MCCSGVSFERCEALPRDPILVESILVESILVIVVESSDALGKSGFVWAEEIANSVQICLANSVWTED